MRWRNTANASTEPIFHDENVGEALNFGLGGFLHQSIFLATPIFFAALGGVLSERAGIFALGLEGFMLVGAFAAIWAADAYGSFILAACAAVLAGSLYSLIFGGATITFGANQILAAVATNILSGGLTTYLARSAWGVGAAPVVRVAGRYPIPLLSDIPLVGQVIFNQPVLSYVSFALVLLSSFVMWKTRWGLIIRAAGEKAAAVDTSGYSVWRVRYLAVIASGALAALGGASLSLSQAQTFTNSMSGGRGFVALTAAVFGRWKPSLALVGALLFGAIDAFQLRLQISLAGGSSYLIQSIPSVIAIAAIVAAGKGSLYPGNIGIPYRREDPS